MHKTIPIHTYFPMFIDAITLPIYLLTDQQLIAKTEYQAYSYGLLYGAIAALLIYNIILFFSLRDRRYFSYSVFLSFFLAMNFAYTGHGFRWLWPMLMIGLGLLSLKFGYQAAFYFLLGSISAAIGTFVTALSVWGLIPFNDFTFRAVEIGMLIDAVLLALALAELVRESQLKKSVAENIALLAPLTGLYNRRGLYKKRPPFGMTF